MAGILAQLPHLTDEELEQLEIAVKVRVTQFKLNVDTAISPRMKVDFRRALQINQSLLTAIAEARLSLRPPDRDRV